jgi:hypothetical protein
MTDRTIYLMQLQRAAFALIRARDKAPTEQERAQLRELIEQVKAIHNTATAAAKEQGT